MAKVINRDQTESPTFEGKEKCITVLHSILQSVTFNFEIEPEDGEVITDHVIFDATLRDLARQIVEHPHYLAIFPETMRLRPVLDLTEINGVWTDDLHQAQQAAQDDAQWGL